MSKSKKNKKRTDIKVGDHTIEDIKWEDLASDAIELTKQLNFYIHTVKKIYEENQDIIEKDRKLKETVSGFSGSILDLVNQVIETRNIHMLDTAEGLVSTKTGIIEDDNDIYLYFNIKNRYAAYFESLSNLTSHLFMDIMVSIKSSNNQDIVNEFTNNVQRAQQAVADVMNPTME